MHSKRNRLDVIATILGSCREGKERKNHLLRASGIDSEGFSKCLAFMESQELVKVNKLHARFITVKATEKGIQYLITYEKIAELLEGPKTSNYALVS